MTKSNKTRSAIPLLLVTLASFMSGLMSCQEATADGETVPVYRFFKGRYSNYGVDQGHFYTLSYSEGERYGYQYEGVGFNLYYSPPATIQGRQAIALYRCLAYRPGARNRNENMNFISLDAGCEGHIQEGLLGYGTTGQAAPGMNPLYRFFGNSDHLITMWADEGWNAGYQYEALLALVPIVANEW